MELTKDTIAALDLPEGINDKVYFDDDLPGFGIRMRRGGAKTWHVQYDRYGRTRRMSGGPVNIMTVALAREWARKILAQVRLGKDPAADKAKRRDDAKLTVGAQINPYLERRKTELRPRSHQTITHHLQVHAKPLHPLPIAEVTRRDIAGVLAEIERERGPAARNNARSALSSFFTWAAKEAYCDANPVTFTNMAEERGPRNRLLTDEEIRAIWQVADDSPHDSIVKMLLLLGLRRHEVGDLHWREVDLDAATITLPPERTKNRRKFVVPVTAAALTILKAQPNDGRPYVFSNRVTYGFKSWWFGKEQLNARLAAAGYKIENWWLHDFRRAVSTTLYEWGTRSEVVETILGHTVKGVAGVYNLAQHVDERRRVLEKWAAHVTGQPEAKVVQLRK